MTVWFLIDIAVLFLVTLLTGIIIPQILLIAFRKNLFDEPDPRKIHKTEVPRLGGIAFFPSILFALLLLFGLGIMNGSQSVYVLQTAILEVYLARYLNFDNIHPLAFYLLAVPFVSAVVLAVSMLMIVGARKLVSSVQCVIRNAHQ